MFGAAIGTSPPPAPPPAGGGGGTAVVGNCLTYTVKTGDTLTSIAAEFDVTGGYQKIYELNMEVNKGVFVVLFFREYFESFMMIF